MPASTGSTGSTVVRVPVVGAPVADRPPAITRADFVRITTAVTQAVADGASAVLLHSEPGWFCAGADLDDVRSHLADVDGYVADFDRCLEVVGTAGVPVVVAVGGPAIGAGFELALCADAVLATDDAWFSFPEARFGLPALSGALRLSAAVGSVRARNILLTCRRVPGAEAHALGIVTDLVPAAELDQRAAEVAAGFATGSAEAVAAIRTAIATAPLSRQVTRPWVEKALGS